MPNNKEIILLLALNLFALMLCAILFGASMLIPNESDEIQLSAVLAAEDSAIQRLAFLDSVMATNKLGSENHTKAMDQKSYWNDVLKRLKERRAEILNHAF